ncbi:MAG: ABC transporter permease [Phycisphaerae bacterium]
MRKVGVIAMREYRANVRSKAFLIAVILMPIFMSGSIVVQGYMEKRGESGVRKIAVIDHTGKLFSALRDAAVRRNREEIFDPETGKQREATYELIETPPQADHPDEQLLDLSNQVRDEKLFAFVEIKPDVFKVDETYQAGAIRYHTNRQTDRGVPRWIASIINEEIKAARLKQAGLDPAVVRRAMTWVDMEYLGLLRRGEAGEIEQAKAANPMLSFFMPFGVLMLMFMIMMIAVQPLLQGVLEEKQQRIAEVLLGSAPPFELMMGKLLGHVLVALTLITVYFSGGYFVAQRLGHADMIHLSLIVWFIVFESFGILMFGSLFLAVGACCNDLRDTQSLVMPVMFPLILPMFFMVPIIRDPSGPIALGGSLFPLTAPMVMVMRLSMEANVPTWQPMVAIAGCVLATLFCVWVAGRIFRVGILAQGKTPKFGQIIRWVARG